MWNVFKDWLKKNLPAQIIEKLKTLKAAVTGIAAVPEGTDWVGYETLIKFIKKYGLLSVEGDFLEIGTFLCGGARKLSKFIEKSGKKLFVVDVFDPTFDISQTEGGRKAMDLYLKALNGRSQYEIYQEAIAGCKNIITLVEDSKKVKIPIEKLAFAFVDGNHAPSYVESDFYLVWNILSSGGGAAFHDYGGDLPATTAAIDRMIKENYSQIEETEYFKKKNILFVLKK